MSLWAEQVWHGIDGSSNEETEGVGLVLTFIKGDHLEYAVCLEFQTSTNEVKYETLIIGLKLAKVVGTIVVAIQNGSQMVVKQVKSALWSQGRSNEEMIRYNGRSTKKFCSSGHHTDAIGEERGCR